MTITTTRYRRRSGHRQGGVSQTTTTTTTSPTTAALYWARYLATLAVLLNVTVLAAASYSPASTVTSNATAHANTTNRMINVDPDSVYVPGYRFSWFWYTLSQLSYYVSNSTANSYCRRCLWVYHCYSAGCLAVLPPLSGRGLWDVLNAKDGARRGWIRGKIGWYDIVPTFVSNLLLLTTTTNSTPIN